LQEVDRRILEITREALESIKRYGQHKLFESILLHRGTESIQDGWMDARREGFAVLKGEEGPSEMARAKWEGIVKDLVGKFVEKAYKNAEKPDFDLLSRSLSKLFDGIEFRFDSEKLEEATAETLTEMLWDNLSGRLDAVAGNETDCLLQRLFFDVEGHEIIEKKNTLVFEARTADFNRQWHSRLADWFRTRRFRSRLQNAERELEREIRERQKPEYLVDKLVERTIDEIEDEKRGEVLVEQDFTRGMEKRMELAAERERKLLEAQENLEREKADRQKIRSWIREKASRRLIKKGKVIDTVTLEDLSKPADARVRPVEEEARRRDQEQLHTSRSLRPVAAERESREKLVLTVGETVAVETAEAARPEETPAETRGEQADITPAGVRVDSEGIVRVDSIRDPNALAGTLSEYGARPFGRTLVVAEHASADMSYAQRKEFDEAVRRAREDERQLAEGMRQMVVLDASGKVVLRVTADRDTDPMDLSGADLSQSSGVERNVSGTLVWSTEDGTLKAVLKRDLSDRAFLLLHRDIAAGRAPRVNRRGGILAGEYAKIPDFERLRGVVIDSVVTGRVDASRIEGEVLSSLVDREDFAVKPGRVVFGANSWKLEDDEPVPSRSVQEMNTITPEPGDELERRAQKGRIRKAWDGLLRNTGFAGKAARAVHAVLFAPQRSAWGRLKNTVLRWFGLVPLDYNPNLKILRKLEDLPVECIARPENPGNFWTRLWPWSETRKTERRIRDITEEAALLLENGESGPARERALEAIRMNCFSKPAAQAMLVLARANHAENEELTSRQTDRDAGTEEIDRRIERNRRVAEAALERYFKISGKRAATEALVLRGDFALAKGRSDEAVESYQRAFEQRESSLEALNGWIKALEEYREPPLVTEAEYAKIMQGALKPEELEKRREEQGRKAGERKARIRELKKERIRLFPDSSKAEQWILDYAEDAVEAERPDLAAEMLRSGETDAVKIRRIELGFENAEQLREAADAIDRSRLDASDALVLAGFYESRGEAREALSVFEAALDRPMPRREQRRLRKEANRFLRRLKDTVATLIDGYEGGSWNEKRTAKKIDAIVALFESVSSSLLDDVSRIRGELAKVLSDFDRWDKRLDKLFRFVGRNLESRGKVAAVLYDLGRRIRDFEARQKKDTRALGKTRRALKKLESPDRAAVLKTRRIRALRRKEARLIEKVLDLGFEMREALHELEAIEKDVSALPDNESSMMLIRDYEKMLFDFIKVVNLEVIPQEAFPVLNRVYRSVYDGIIRVNHHPRFVFKAYLGSISGLVARGDVNSAVTKFREFEDKMQNRYFDRLFEEDADANRKELLRRYLRTNIENRRFTAAEIIGLAQAALKAGETGLVQELLPLVGNRSLSRSEDLALADLETRLQAMLLESEDERAQAAFTGEPEKTVEQMRRESRLFKWLAVSIGSRRIMPEDMRSVREHTPLKAMQTDARIRELIAIAQNDPVLYESLKNFRKLIRTGKADRGMDLALFQAEVFDRIAELDADIRGVPGTSRIAPLRSRVRVAGFKHTQPLTGQAWVKREIDLTHLGNTELTGEELTHLVWEFLDAVQYVESENRTRQGFSFTVYVNANQEALQKQLDAVGLGERVETLPPFRTDPDELKPKSGERRATRSAA
jgi:hypothetical protein